MSAVFLNCDCLSQSALLVKMVGELHTDRRSANVWPSAGRQTTGQAVSCTAQHKGKDTRLAGCFQKSGSVFLNVDSPRWERQEEGRQGRCVWKLWTLDRGPLQLSLLPAIYALVVQLSLCLRNISMKQGSTRKRPRCACYKLSPGALP